MAEHLTQVSRGSPRPAPVLMVVVATLVPLSLCPLWLPALPAYGFWIARGLAIAGSVFVVIAAGGRREEEGGLLPVLASPAFTLPLLALVFYSLLPALYVEFLMGGPQVIPPGARPEELHNPNGRYLLYATASTAESWVIAFSGIGLLLATAFDRLIPSRPESRALASPVCLAWSLALICGAGAAFHVGKRLLPSLAAPWMPSLVDTLPPLVMFGIGLLVQTHPHRPIRRSIWSVIGFAGGFGLLFPYQIKALVLFAVTALLRAMLHARGWARMALAVVVLASPSLGAGMVMLPRGLSPILAGKIIWRQSETIFCLDFALREAEAGGGEWRAGPFYFATALVPRVLWPDKPSLSHGDVFGKFCGLDIPGHSASITLLGEPALRAGPWGVAAAGLVLAGLSAAVIAAWKRGGHVATAFALGLSPWLIDFDQHFAMYAANLAKAFLAVLPAALVIGYFSRRHRRADPLS